MKDDLSNQLQLADSKPSLRRSRKLNILALPSFTSIMFVLIAFVILGAALTSLLPDSQLWWPPLAFGLLFLPLRDFLQWPSERSNNIIYGCF